VYPQYDFVTHKGYITPTHTAALAEHGPCAVHRHRFVNVRRAAGLGDNEHEETPMPVLEAEDVR
jgi:ribonuclease HII